MGSLASIKVWLGNVAHEDRMAAFCAAIAAIAEGAKVLAMRVGLC